MGRHPLELAECLLGWVDASAERLARWADPLTTDWPTPSRVGRVPAGMGGCIGREASGVGRSANNGLADTLSRRPSTC